jgi:hypothetical protein
MTFAEAWAFLAARGSTSVVLARLNGEWIAFSRKAGAA